MGDGVAGDVGPLTAFADQSSTIDISNRGYRSLPEPLRSWLQRGSIWLTIVSKVSTQIVRSSRNIGVSGLQNESVAPL
jgi:hypothetical protein